MLGELEECPVHKESIDYYCNEELPESAQLDMPAVTYGCLRCTKTLENGADFRKIDKANLLNVY